MKKSVKRIIIAILSASGIYIIVKYILPIIIFAIVISLGSDMTPKKDVFKTVEQNQDVISAAAYVMQSNDIVGIYDHERCRPPSDITWISGDYTIRETEEYDTPSGKNKLVYEQLTDEKLIAALNLNGVQRITKDSDTIEIYFGGRGIAPSGAHCGVYYLPNDSFEAAKEAIPYYVEKSKLVPRDKGYMYQISDNTFYMERICDNLWYYEETW